MTALLLLIAATALLVLAVWLAIRKQKGRRLARRDFIRGYRFPPGIFTKLRVRHPQLSAEQEALVARALRDFFVFHLYSGNSTVGMPSRIVDDLWHEFILDTRAYAAFCQQAFGGFFHHIPSGGMGHGKKEDAALRRTWRLACIAERMHPRKARTLPLIFGIDGKLAVAGGLAYSLRWAGQEQRKDGGCGGGACGGGGLASGPGSGCAGSGCGGAGGCGGGCGGG